MAEVAAAAEVERLPNAGLQKQIRIAVEKIEKSEKKDTILSEEARYTEAYLFGFERDMELHAEDRKAIVAAARAQLAQI